MGTIANLGDLVRFANMYSRVKQAKKLDLLLLGGSITAGGYFMEYVKSMQDDSKINVTFHNHGHGATEITCKSFPNYPYNHERQITKAIFFILQ